MAMAFNPYTSLQRGMDLGSPASSQGGINSLLNMQQNTLENLVNTFGNVGKTNRTNTVNDLIARGGLEGLNEAQTQARIQQEAGGTLTPEGQTQVDKLLQTVGKDDQRKFTTQERLGEQSFLSGENETKAEALRKAQETKNALDKLMNDQNLTQKEKDSVRDFKASMYGHEVTRGGQKQLVQGSDGMQYMVDKPTGALTKLMEGVLPYGGKGSGGDKFNPTELTGTSKKFYEELTGKAKEAYKRHYETGELQTVGTPYKDLTTGTTRIAYKTLFKGKEVTPRELMERLERKK